MVFTRSMCALRVKRSIVLQPACYFSCGILGETGETITSSSLALYFAVAAFVSAYYTIFVHRYNRTVRAVSGRAVKKINPDRIFDRWNIRFNIRDQALRRITKKIAYSWISPLSIARRKYFSRAQILWGTNVICSYKFTRPFLRNNCFSPFLFFLLHRVGKMVYLRSPLLHCLESLECTPASGKFIACLLARAASTRKFSASRRATREKMLPSRICQPSSSSHDTRGARISFADSYW